MLTPTVVWWWARGRRAHRGFASIAACLLLSGCEPPLSLSEVDKLAANPVRRTDEFQAAAGRGDTVVVVGNHGLVAVSSDAGVHWKRSTLPDWPALISVAACGSNAFAAISYEGALWLSRDAGATWRSSPVGISPRLQAISCDQLGRIWIVGESATVSFSQDNGAHWRTTTLDPQDLFLTTVQFVDETHGYVTGEFGTVLKTSDGGATWQKLAAMPGEMYPEAAYFSDAEHGWAVGLSGTILETVDGAQHWNAAKVAASTSLYGIASVDDVMYAVGGDGTILRREGQAWVSLPGARITHSYLRVVLRAGDGHFLVAGGSGSILRLAVDPKAPPVVAAANPG